MSFQSPQKTASRRDQNGDEEHSENPITHKSPSKKSTKQKMNKKSFDVSKLRLPLQRLNTNHDSKRSDIAIPLSAPSRLNRPRRLSRNQPRNPKAPALSARGHRSNGSRSQRAKRRSVTVPYTPRLDELPLTVRLHSNPMVLVQSLRRQKISNYNMFHIEPAIDNQPDRFLTKYALRRQRIRESGNPFPNMPALPIQIPVFVAKQLKYEKVANDIRKQQQHQYRLQHMTPHIDNRLPSNVQSYRRMRRQRLKNAQKKARKLHELRLQSPPAKAPKPPTRKLPANLRKSVSQIRRESALAKEQGQRIKEEAERKKKEEEKTKKMEFVNYHEIKYVDEQEARNSKFSPSPKKARLSKVEELAMARRSSLVHALPCHFDEWK